jgi:hypothetical protein
MDFVGHFLPLFFGDFSSIKKRPVPNAMPMIRAAIPSYACDT